MVGYVIIIVFFAVLVAVIINEVRRSRSPRPGRDASGGLPVRYRAPVFFKRDRAPTWALGALGFELFVKDGLIAVIGPGEGASSYLVARDTTIERCNPTNRSPEWIVLTGKEDGKPVRVWIRPRDGGSLWEMWSAIVSEGTEPLTDPPLMG